ncbi:hypothetical protein [Myceligenerans indicum]|uniref:Lipid A biosynthesis lauroyl acyltransferase n=1 Tax=Myceligenerans indicum TaxID=2593663 RepID=A0ABS1LIX2_9MICO|nr:hypothetical protein [Myceligenerans indicum]MBL0886195.1 lipid A biosynthesis lauroyl acyltransferase [Myceligenerans indicum]
MDIEFMWKDENSTGGNCPALYRTAGGDYVVQGARLDADTRARLRDLAESEDAVVVPANVLDRLRGAL